MPFLKEETQQAGVCILNFPDSKSVIIAFLLFVNYLALKHFVIALQMHWNNN